MRRLLLTSGHPWRWLVGETAETRTDDAIRLLLRGLLRVPRKSSPSGEDAPVGSPARFLLLAVLREGACHGYELQQRYERRFGRLVPLGGNTGVYRWLDVLERDGYVRGRRLSAEARVRGVRVPRVTYDISETGERALDVWVLSPVRRQQWRAELLARIDVASGLGERTLCDLVSRYADERAIEEQEVAAEIAEMEESELAAGVAMGRRLVLQERQGALAWQQRWTVMAREQLAGDGPR